MYSRGGKQAFDVAPVEWARHVERLGAGEILLSSIDRDGMMTGYDIELCSQIVSSVRIPVIASGGAGQLQHFAEVIQVAGVAAVNCASVFHYTQVTPQLIKSYLAAAGIDIRME